MIRSFITATQGILNTIWLRLLTMLFVGLVAFIVASPMCSAQAVPWTYAGVWYPPAGGSFTYNGAATPPTYTTAGTSSGFGFFDSLSFSSVVTTGNVDIEARLASQSSSNAGAQSGLMMRQTFSKDAGMAAINVTVGGGINFIYKIPGTSEATVAGPSSVTLPVYLRLAKNGDTISGYYASASDPQTWTLVGSFTQTNNLSKHFYIGFESSSTNSSVNTAVFDYVTYMTSVPQQSATMPLWLRSDTGITSSAGSISSWTDSSGNGHDATQGTRANKPSLSTGALNNGVLSSVLFNGTSQHLVLPTNFSDLTAGYSCFILLKPTSASATCTPVTLGNASNSDAIISRTIGTQAALYAFNGATSSNVTTTTNPLSNSQYKLLEETLIPGATSGTATGTIFVNGTQIIQSTSLQNLTNTSRSSNYVGVGSGLTNYFVGNIAEILVYSYPLTASQRTSVESYFLSKFGIGTAPTLNAPTFTPTGGIFTTGQTVTMAQDQNALIYYSLNGSAPSSSTSQWSIGNSITLRDSITLKAVAVAPFFNDSSIASTVLKLDNDTVPVSRSGLKLWLRADNGLTSASSLVSNWSDSSGSGNDAFQATGSAKPTFLSNGVNGKPAVTFATSKFMQIPAGMSDFSAGASVFAVVRPTAVTANQRIFDFGNGASSNNIYLNEPSTNAASLFTFSGASGTSVSSPSAITLNQFQVLEAVHNGAGTANIYTNGLLGGTSAVMNNLTTITRSNNFIGQASQGGLQYRGDLAELLVYNRGLFDSERASIEGYLLGRYQPAFYNVPTAPKFSMATSTLTAPGQLAIEAPAEAQIRLTTDGTTPTISSALYSKPLDVCFTQTIKALTVMNGKTSSVTTATFTLDGTKWPAPASTTSPLQLDLQLPSPVIPQDNNQN